MGGVKGGLELGAEGRWLPDSFCSEVLLRLCMTGKGLYHSKRVAWKKKEKITRFALMRIALATLKAGPSKLFVVISELIEENLGKGEVVKRGNKFQKQKGARCTRVTPKFLGKVSVRTRGRTSLVITVGRG